MNPSLLLALIAEQYAEILQLRAQVTELKKQAEATAVTGVTANGET